MRNKLIVVSVLLLIAASAGTLSAQTQYDVIIQAGHQGRPEDCKSRGGPESESLCHNTGSPVPPGEKVWTPMVADEAAGILEAAGVKVLRLPGYVPGTYHVKAAVFIHFDGADTPCSSGASVGYPPGSSRDAAIADAWKALYAAHWPYKVMRDNFTPNERDYYAYHHVIASKGEFLMEGGEMSCPKQYAWLKAHLNWEAALLAHFLSDQIGKGDVPMPRLPSWRR
jgi:hypothetical protein